MEGSPLYKPNIYGATLVFCQETGLKPHSKNRKLIFVKKKNYNYTQANITLIYNEPSCVRDITPHPPGGVKPPKVEKHHS